MKQFTTKITTTKLSLGIMLTSASLFIACSDSKVSGTDEQANSVNADPTIQAWLEGDTLKSEATCIDCSDTSSEEPSIPVGIMTENGRLVQIKKKDFESIYCETKENWFVYSVKVTDISVDKNFTLPDSMSPEAFEQDCERERGYLEENSIGVPGQKSYTCQMPMLDTVAAPGSMRYFDANWNKYAQQIVDLCGEPLEEVPLILDE